MLHALTLALAAALTVQQVETQTASSRDSAETIRDSVRRERRERRHEHNSSVLRARKTRIPLTDELRANAYRDATARDIVSRARLGRLEQDSSIIAYDARTLQRISAKLGLRAVGRERLAFRNESATRVRWHRETGAWIDVEGAQIGRASCREGGWVWGGARRTRR